MRSISSVDHAGMDPQISTSANLHGNSKPTEQYSERN